jgi:hypothetical protein
MAVFFFSRAVRAAVNVMIITHVSLVVVFQANEQRLRQMSAADIAAAQEEITSILSPESIAFLQTRAAQRLQDSMTRGSSSASARADAKDTLAMPTTTRAVRFADEPMVEPLRSSPEQMTSLPLVPDSTVSAPIDTWNTPLPEHGPVSVPLPAQPPAEQLFSLLEHNPVSRWRFDFQGVRLPTAAQQPMDATSGLFHHGDDPTQAGYTLAELIHLSRSSMASQASLALAVLTRVLHASQSATGVHMADRRDAALTGAAPATGSSPVALSVLGWGTMVWQYCVEGGLLFILIQLLQRRQTHRVTVIALAECLEALLVHPAASGTHVWRACVGQMCLCGCGE